MLAQLLKSGSIVPKMISFTTTSEVVIRKIEMRSRTRNLHLQWRRHNVNDYTMNVRFFVILTMVHLNPHISLRKIQYTLGIPKSTAGKYLKAVRYHSYDIILNQAQIEHDYRKRLLVRQWAYSKFKMMTIFSNTYFSVMKPLSTALEH